MVIEKPLVEVGPKFHDVNEGIAPSSPITADKEDIPRLSPASTQLLVTQRHLVAAADNMRPSVTATERRRYQYM